MLECGIGRAHNLALASLPNFSLPGDISASKRYWARDVITKPFEVSADGTVEVPTGPGIGVDIDHAFLDEITVDRREFTGALIARRESVGQPSPRDDDMAVPEQAVGVRRRSDSRARARRLHVRRSPAGWRPRGRRDR